MGTNSTNRHLEMGISERLGNHGTSNGKVKRTFFVKNGQFWVSWRFVWYLWQYGWTPTNENHYECISKPNLLNCIIKYHLLYILAQRYSENHKTKEFIFRISAQEINFRPYLWVRKVFYGSKYQSKKSKSKNLWKLQASPKKIWCDRNIYIRKIKCVWFTANFAGAGTRGPQTTLNKKENLDTWKGTHL